MCVNWTPMGGRTTTAHEAERIGNVFVAERDHLGAMQAEDFFFHENSHLFPVQAKVAPPFAEAPQTCDNQDQWCAARVPLPSATVAVFRVST